MCGGVSRRIGCVDAPEGSCVRRLDGRGGGVVRCNIPLSVQQRLAHLPWPLYGCGNKKYLISYCLIWISDLQVWPCYDAWKYFLRHILFLRLVGELGVLCRGLHTRWRTYIPININDFNQFPVLHFSMEGWRSYDAVATHISLSDNAWSREYLYKTPHLISAI